MFRATDPAEGASAAGVELDQLRQRQLLYDRVNDALDQLEDDPHEARLRRRSYADPPVWGVPVTADRWLILWDLVGEVVTVFYLGPDLR